MSAMYRSGSLTFLLVLLLAAGVALPASSWAEEKSFTASHTYVMGDNDTRAEARRIAFLEARRKAAEQAGVYVESVTSVGDQAVTGDDIRSVAAAVVKAEILEEKLTRVGESLAVTVTVKATVDPERTTERLERLADDPASLARLRGEMATERGLEDRAVGLQGEIAAGGNATAARHEQARVFGDLEALRAERDRMLAEHAESGRRARELVRPGMSAEEVVSLLGPARAGKRSSFGGSEWLCANYGEVWIVYRDGLVECLRARLTYRAAQGGDCHCAGMLSPGDVFSN